MDLSFTRAFATRVTALPQDVAVMLAAATARQGASATACAANGLRPRSLFDVLLAPESGSFSAATATVLRHWKG